MEEISDIYGTLSSKKQAAISDLLFGSQNQKQGDALIRSFQSGQVQKAYEAAASSSGSAYKAQEDWMNSMQAKTTQFQAAFQSLSNTIFSDNLPKFFTELGTAGVSALDNLIEKFWAQKTWVSKIKQTQNCAGPNIYPVARWKSLCKTLRTIYQKYIGGYIGNINCGRLRRRPLIGLCVNCTASGFREGRTRTRTAHVTRNVA